MWWRLQFFSAFSNFFPCLYFSNSIWLIKALPQGNLIKIATLLFFFTLFSFFLLHIFPWFNLANGNPTTREWNRLPFFFSFLHFSPFFSFVFFPNLILLIEAPQQGNVLKFTILLFFFTIVSFFLLHIFPWFNLACWSSTTRKCDEDCNYFPNFSLSLFSHFSPFRHLHISPPA